MNRPPIKAVGAVGRGRLWRRHVPGEMNGTERRFAEVLQGRKLAGEVHEWFFEAVRLKLARGSYYTPDFLTLEADGTIKFWDTKGGGPEDPNGNTKLKVAAAVYWWFTFVKATEVRRGGGWKFLEL